MVLVYFCVPAYIYVIQPVYVEIGHSTCMYIGHSLDEWLLIEKTEAWERSFSAKE